MREFIGPKGKKISASPAKVTEELYKIEDATVGQELQAEWLGLSSEELEEEDKKESGVEYHRREPTVEDFIRKWEKENDNPAEYGNEQLALGTQVADRTTIQPSPRFLAFVLRKAREKMENGFTYEEDKNRDILKNLSDVRKIEITRAGDGLQFCVHVHKIHYFEYVDTTITLQIDAKGEIVFSPNTNF